MTSLRFAEWMASPAGRLLRTALGFALLIAGIMLGGVAGVALAIVSVVPIAAGAFNVCFIAPLLGVPFRGTRLAPHH